MILRGSVYSEVLGMRTGISFLAPEAPTRPGRYRVAYLLHGLGGAGESWVSNSRLALYASRSDTLFVMPDAVRSFYTDMKFGPAYFSWIAEELPALCDRFFKISTQPEDTALIGVSMGGYGALKCAFTNPARYGFCAAMAPACLYPQKLLDVVERKGDSLADLDKGTAELVRDIRAVLGEKPEWGPANDIPGLAGAAAVSNKRPAVYVACGLSDNLHADAVKFAAFMKTLPFNFTFEDWEGGHDWLFFDEALKRALAAWPK
jgi:S-formylglutathione hydrolase FrmB